MGWLLAVVLIVAAVALIYAGTHGSASQLWQTLTGSK